MSWFEEDGKLRAYDFVSLIEGIKDLYHQGKAIADPHEAYKAGSMFVVPVTVDSIEAERNSFLTWKGLADYLQPIKSKNKIIMWAKKIYNLELNDEDKMLVIKQKILDNAFPEQAPTYFYKEEEQNEEK